jgi:hypothetical protein
VLTVVASLLMIHTEESRNPLRRGTAKVVIALLLLVPGGRAQGQEPSPRAVFAVHLAPQGIPAWRADAIARTLAADLAGGALRELPGRDPCTAAAPACARAYRAAGVDIAVRGSLSADRLSYEILLTWSGASPTSRTGVVDLPGRDRAGLADAMRAALHPVLRPGGALDRRDRKTPAARLVAPAGGVAVLAALAAALLLAPLLLGAVVLGRGAGRLLRTRSLRRSAGVLVAIVVAAGADAVGGTPGPPGWAVFLAGGMAWGTLAAATVPVLFPPLWGLGRVEHGEVFHIVRAWLALVPRRAAQLAMFYAPFGLALWAVCDALELDAALALGVVAPLWCLVARLSLRSLVEVLALRLDRVLIDGDGAVALAWDEAVRAYFLGYLRRAGAEADARLLGEIRFHPGRGEEVALYGGGLAPPRLVIGRELLEVALSPPGRPHDYALPRVSKLHWTEWNAGLVVPTRRDLPMATPEERQPTQMTVEGEIEHQPLGEPRTLAGIVEPAAIDRRITHRPWEDPAWLAWEPGDEHDGTDAGDRDFLFGLLVHELGRALRHEDRLATFALAWARGPGRWPLLGRLPIRRPPALADLQASLNFARHHLIQYLAYRLWHRDEQLTARAHAPELERHTAEIARSAGEESSAPEAALLRRRLVRLAGSALGRPAARWRRRAAVAALALAVGGAAALAAVRAIDYHPIYLERTRERPREHGQAQ